MNSVGGSNDAPKISFWKYLIKNFASETEMQAALSVKLKVSNARAQTIWIASCWIRTWMMPSLKYYYASTKLNNQLFVNLMFFFFFFFFFCSFLFLFARSLAPFICSFVCQSVRPSVYLFISSVSCARSSVFLLSVRFFFRTFWSILPWRAESPFTSSTGERKKGDFSLILSLARGGGKRKLCSQGRSIP